MRMPPTQFLAKSYGDAPSPGCCSDEPVITAALRRVELDRPSWRQAVSTLWHRLVDVKAKPSRSVSIGDNVLAQDGTHLGAVEDIVIDLAGETAYAVFSPHHSLVVQGPLIAVPEEALWPEEAPDEWGLDLEAGDIEEPAKRAVLLLSR